MRTVADVRLLMVALWIGAAIFFSFAVAPGAFAVLPSRELAGNVVNRTLAIINYSGLIIGLILLATSLAARRGISQTQILIEQFLLIVMTIACAVGQFVISAKLHSLREQIGRPIDEMAANDPLRVAFNDLHGYSVIILSAAMIAALIAFFTLARRARNGSYQ